MYKSIYVPVDNSDLSNRAAVNAVQLGKSFESRLTGCHVYAAKMHDYRFKQMEYTLPDEYLDETELDGLRIRSETSYGPLRHLAPVLELSETPPHWVRPTPRLGGDAAAWVAH